MRAALATNYPITPVSQSAEMEYSSRLRHAMIIIPLMVMAAHQPVRLSLLITVALRYPPAAARLAYPTATTAVIMPHALSAAWAIR